MSRQKKILNKSKVSEYKHTLSSTFQLSMPTLSVLHTFKCMNGNSSYIAEAAAFLLSATSVWTQQKCHKEESFSSLPLTLAALATFFTCGSWLQLMDEAAVCYVEHAQRFVCVCVRAHSLSQGFNLLITVTALCRFYVVPD